MYRFRYTDFTNEAPVVFSDPTPLANAARRVATMVDVNLERPVWVYKITHVESGRAYIGITTRESTARRWYEHIHAAGKGAKSRIALAIKKYGTDAFCFEVVYQAVNLREACAVERGMIAQEGTLVNNGFNITSGGEGIPGTALLTETKAKLSRASQDYWRVPENREKMIAAFSKRVLPASHIEHLRKQAAAMKGKKRKPESIEKGRASQMGHPGYFAGREHPSETIETMRDNARKRWRDPNFLAKSETRSAAMSAGCKKSWIDPEARSLRMMRSAATRAKNLALRKASKDGA